MSFRLTGKEEIVIYGAGSRGKELVRFFAQHEFHIKAILDKRAEFLKFVTVDDYVVSVTDPEKYVMDSDNEIAIISLWNARRHDEIAEILHTIGFKYIIYVPMNNTGNRKLMSQMRMIFNEILDGHVYINNVPEYEDVSMNETYSTGRKNIVYMPIELLFTGEKLEVSEELEEAECQKRRYAMLLAGENLMNLMPYYQLYRYLDKAEEECSDIYFRTQIEDYNETKYMEKKQILKDRYALFEIYEKAYEINMEFFIDSAPRVEWNEQGYFNIMDGNHRSSFLFYKGVWDIPVRIREEDQEHLEMLNNLPDDFLCESLALINKKDALSWRKQNAAICGLLQRSDVLHKRIYINLDDAGYISRYCCREGCDLCIDMETEEKFSFALKMRDFFGYHSELVINKREKQEDFSEEGIETDIVVIDEKYISDIGNVCAEKYIIRLEQNGILYNKIKEKNIAYVCRSKIFDGERVNLVIQINEY